MTDQEQAIYILLLMTGRFEEAEAYLEKCEKKE